jgi:L-lactate dehydrogenase complex protein LldG
MDENIVEQFRLKHASVAGIVHTVSGTAEAAEKAAAILREKKAKNVALGELPDEFRQALEQQCAGAGMDLLKPPFDNDGLRQALDAIQAGITRAAFAIAETGAIVEFTTDDALRLVSALPLVHIVMVRVTDIIASLKEAATPIRNFYQNNPLNANVSFISGPSRTADIEMRLIHGVHGPAETHTIIVN